MIAVCRCNVLLLVAIACSRRLLLVCASDVAVRRCLLFVCCGALRLAWCLLCVVDVAVLFARVMLVVCCLLFVELLLCVVRSS